MIVIHKIIWLFMIANFSPYLLITDENHPLKNRMGNFMYDYYKKHISKNRKKYIKSMQAQKVKTAAKKRKTKKVVPFQNIELLNLPKKTTGAHIAVNLRGHWNNDSFNGSQYEIKISDCNQHVLLHGTLSNPLSRKNCLYKIDTLINTLTGFRQEITEQLKNQRLNVQK